MKTRLDPRDPDTLIAVVGGLLGALITVTLGTIFHWHPLITIAAGSAAGGVLSSAYGLLANYREDRAFANLVRDGQQYHEPREEDE